VGSPVWSVSDNSKHSSHFRFNYSFLKLCSIYYYIVNWKNARYNNFKQDFRTSADKTGLLVPVIWTCFLIKYCTFIKNATDTQSPLAEIYHCCRYWAIFKYRGGINFKGVSNTAQNANSKKWVMFWSSGTSLKIENVRQFCNQLFHVDSNKGYR
jgi:hypothetical protein